MPTTLIRYVTISVKCLMLNPETGNERLIQLSGGAGYFFPPLIIGWGTNATTWVC